MNEIAQQLKTGKLTHLMELKLNNVDGYHNAYECAFCELIVVARNLRAARHDAEDESRAWIGYGKCKGL